LGQKFGVFMLRVHDFCLSPELHAISVLAFVLIYLKTREESFGFVPH